MGYLHIHKAEYFGERRLFLQWWADYLYVNMQKAISLVDYAKINNPLNGKYILNRKGFFNHVYLEIC